MDAGAATNVAQELLTAVSGANIGGVLDGVTGLLPTVLPVMIGFLAIRKGISFLIGMLRSA
jgi:hypothetical protein